jgi:hypothetical protein
MINHLSGCATAVHSYIEASDLAVDDPGRTTGKA